MMSGSACQSRRTRSSPSSVTTGCGAAIILGAALLAHATVTGAEPEAFSVDREISTAEFAVHCFGVFTQHGTFRRADGMIVLDAEEHSGTVDLVVETGSVDTGWSIGDAWLRSEDMFDVEHFPAMRFRSSRLVFDHSRLTEVDGSLTLRGVTRPVSLKVGRMECSRDGGQDRACSASAVSRIRRSDFGLSYGLSFIADDIDLSFRIAASRAGTQSASRQ